MLVQTILNVKGTDVVSVLPTETVAEAVATLHRHRIGAVLVRDEIGALLGILSERDIVRTLGSRGPEALGQSIGDVMTKNVVTCSDGETIDSVMSRMTRGRFRHLPVAEGGRLTGIVSIGDVVKARIEQVEREAEEMRAYIATA